MDLSAESIEFECPACAFTNTVTLRQVELEEQIICDGCLEMIHIHDEESSTRRAREDVESALNSLEGLFKRGFT